MKLREGAEEATMPTKGQPKEATTSEDNSGMTEAHSEAASNLASWLQLSLVNGQVRLHALMATEMQVMTTWRNFVIVLHSTLHWSNCN